MQRDEGGGTVLRGDAFLLRFVDTKIRRRVGWDGA